LFIVTFCLVFFLFLHYVDADLQKGKHAPHDEVDEGDLNDRDTDCYSLARKKKIAKTYHCDTSCVRCRPVILSDPNPVSRYCYTGGTQKCEQDDGLSGICYFGKCDHSVPSPSAKPSRSQKPSRSPTPTPTPTPTL